MANPNSVTLNVPAGTGAFWCISNALYTQQVTLTSTGSAATYVFQGSGEGVPMICDIAANPILPFTQPDVQVTATFEYSPNGQPPFTPASVVKEPVIIQFESWWIAQVESEDLADDGDSDCRLQVVVQMPDPPAGDAG